MDDPTRGSGEVDRGGEDTDRGRVTGIHSRSEPCICASPAATAHRRVPDQCHSNDGAQVPVPLPRSKRLRLQLCQGQRRVRTPCEGRFVLGNEACIQLQRSQGYFLLPTMYSFPASAVRGLLFSLGVLRGVGIQCPPSLE